MAAFTAARRDLAAALLPAALTGAADGFWGRELTMISDMQTMRWIKQCNDAVSMCGYEDSSPSLISWVVLVAYAPPPSPGSPHPSKHQTFS